MDTPLPTVLTFDASDPNDYRDGGPDIQRDLLDFVGLAVAHGVVAFFAHPVAMGVVTREPSFSPSFAGLGLVVDTLGGFPLVVDHEHPGESEVWAVCDADVLAEMGHGRLLDPPPTDEVRLAGGPRDGELVRLGGHAGIDRVCLFGTAPGYDVGGYVGSHKLDPFQKVEYVRTGRRDARGREVYALG